ncbi:MAG: hypothetical protein J2P44_01295 [Candidatus Dormibacteraeota bacterium]|nr:hypothetical protein [Candidatus Dormibacteraeota bacterium]
MSPAALSQYAIYAAIAVFVIYRQLAPRQVRGAGGTFILPFVLTAYGAYSLLQSPPGAATTYLLLAGELALAAVAGVARGLTIRFWTDRQGVLMQRGTWLTLVIWALFIGIRVATYALAGGALATPALMLSVGASLLVQAGVTYLRSQALLQHPGAQPRQELYR